MAISGPYVHTHYKNYEQVNILSTISINGQEQTYLQHTIDALQQLRSQLKQAADDFLQGKNYQEVWDEISDPNNTLGGVGMTVLRSYGFYNQLSDNVGNFYRYDDLIHTIDHTLLDEMPYVLNDMGEKIIDINVITNQIMKKAFGKIPSKSIQVTPESILPVLEQIIPTESDLLDAWLDITNLSKKADGWSVSSSTAKNHIKNAFSGIEADLLDENKTKIGTRIVHAGSKYTAGKKETTQFETSVLTYFEPKFRQKLNELHIAYEEKKVQEYLDEFKNQLHKSLQDAPTATNKSHLSGHLGEYLFGAVVNTNTTIQKNNNGATITLTGSWNENDVRKHLNLDNNITNVYGKKITKSLENYKTWISLSKMSPADLLITLSGKTIRAQAKNYVEVYQQFIHNNMGPMNQAIKLVESQNMMDFLNTLESNNLITFNAERLGYILANEIWFNIKGDLNGMRIGWNENNLLTQALAPALTNFMGLVLDDNFVIIPSLSNIFYVIDNAALIPTYVIIEHIIDELTGKIERRFKGISMSKGQPIGTKFLYNNPQKFWDAKLAQMSKDDDNLNYSSPYIDVGMAQGETILNTSQFQRINLNLDLKSLVTSSYLAT